MKIADWMFENGWTPADMRCALGMKSRSTVLRYMRNEKKPRSPVVQQIELITGGEVKEADFDDPRDPEYSVRLLMPDGTTKLFFPDSPEYDAEIAKRAKAEELDQGPCWQIRMAERLLGKRQKWLRKGIYLLDGREVDYRRLIEAANSVRAEVGQGPIPYPGMKDGKLLDER